MIIKYGHMEMQSKHNKEIYGNLLASMESKNVMEICMKPVYKIKSYHLKPESNSSFV